MINEVSRQDPNSITSHLTHLLSQTYSYIIATVKHEELIWPKNVTFIDIEIFYVPVRLKKLENFDIYATEATSKSCI